MPSVSTTQYGTYRVLWYSGNSKKQKTFPTKTEAKKFAAALELSPEEKSSHISLGDLLIEYRDKVTRNKKGQREETYRINRILKTPIAQKMISDITVTLVAKISFRDKSIYRGHGKSDTLTNSKTT